jgi:hypothetical protein
MRQYHDIGTSPSVDGILITSEIVGRIVDVDSLVMVNPISREMHSGPVCCSEPVLVTLIRHSLDAAK